MLLSLNFIGLNMLKLSQTYSNMCNVGLLSDSGKRLHDVFGEGWSGQCSLAAVKMDLNGK